MCTISVTYRTGYNNRLIFCEEKVFEKRRDIQSSLQNTDVLGGGRGVGFEPFRWRNNTAATQSYQLSFSLSIFNSNLRSTNRSNYLNT